MIGFSAAEASSPNRRLKEICCSGSRTWSRMMSSPSASTQPARRSWRRRSGGKYYGPREAARNWHEVPFLPAFRDATGAENRVPPGGSKRTCRGKWPGFAGFQARNPDGKYCWTPVLRHLWALEVLADGKNSLREPPHGSAPQKPQGSEAPRPAGRALGALSHRLEAVVGCAEQPGVRALQWRASVFQLDDVIDEHASLSATTARRLASSACFASHSIAQRYPWWRRVEPVRHLGRQCRGAQIRQRDTRLQRL